MARGFTYAITAGTLAALGNVTAKLTFSQAEAQRLCLVSLAIFSTILPVDETCRDWVLLFQGVSAVVCIVSNATMVPNLVKALALCENSVQAVVINTAVQVIVTSLVGMFLLGEQLGVFWWMGMTFILLGFHIIYRSQDNIFKAS
ncbi:unnamed protein product [Darwinula stevensoni]|uniref:EamA domain-containing protein n=1 Tax=Darwinula stevensoni TaxID=69355 RepID=A0A7R8WXS0_9CRUS|nr:unnamed protein product [Darwinula stevensoni]CAG0878664.1 unnamed protein product [Darwinula stevensoni]